MSDTIYKPLTPELRREINTSIDKNMSELNTCNPNAFVSAQMLGNTTLRNVINALPDGYPIPFIKEG